MDVIKAGEEVYHGSGKIVASTIKATYYGIYYGAHWAPPCRLFTQVLTEFYNEVNKDLPANDKKFEVLFVSLDGSHDAFLRNFKDMKWLGVSMNEDQRISALKQKFGVNGVPTLVITKPNGDLISYDGRKDIQDGAEALNSWEKKANPTAQQPEESKDQTQIDTN